MALIDSTPDSGMRFPPCGWNSWDAFGASVTEQELIENAKVMHKHLLSYGWDTCVCDIQWSEPDAKSWEYNHFNRLSLDTYGRQVPAVNRFPSAKDNNGFREIAKTLHTMGLKFGLHLMRGIPRQAVHENLPIFNSKWFARDIVDIASICAWNTDMYGINASHPGAQEYYDSVFKLFAEWGVDYVKVDDIAWNFVASEHYCKGEVELIHRAIRNSGRKMILSLSPGPASLSHKEHLGNYANAWRITDDFWDEWALVKRAYNACVNWAGSSCSGNWPDADMLPFGRIRMRKTSPEDRKPGELSHLTPEEETSVFRLWCLFHSPLMIGADLTASSPELLRRLTHSELLEWNRSKHTSKLLSTAASELMVWTQEGPITESNHRDSENTNLMRFPLLFINRSDSEYLVDPGTWLDYFFTNHISHFKEIAVYEEDCIVQEIRYIKPFTLKPHESRAVELIQKTL